MQYPRIRVFMFSQRKLVSGWRLKNCRVGPHGSERTVLLRISLLYSIKCRTTLTSAETGTRILYCCFVETQRQVCAAVCIDCFWMTVCVCMRRLKADSMRSRHLGDPVRDDINRHWLEPLNTMDVVCFLSKTIVCAAFMMQAAHVSKYNYLHFYWHIFYVYTVF